MSIAKQCVTGGRGRRNAAFLQPTTSIPSTWNSLIPSDLSEAVILYGGLSSANSLENGEVLYFTPTFALPSVSGLALLDLSLYLGDTVSQFKSAEDVDVSLLAQSPGKGLN